jgi:hypothetical protein
MRPPGVSSTNFSVTCGSRHANARATIYNHIHTHTHTFPCYMGSRHANARATIPRARPKDGGKDRGARGGGGWGLSGLCAA